MTLYTNLLKHFTTLIRISKLPFPINKNQIIFEYSKTLY